MSKTLNVLFIGNSYTYYNDMPEAYFKRLLSDAGYDASVTAITKGGAYLSQYADPEHEQGIRLRDTVDGQHYDVCVIQEQSINPIKDEQSFLGGVRDVAALVDAEHFVLYSTWGRNEGSPKLWELGLTREEMTERLSDAYNKAGKLYGMTVAEVGRAFLAYESRDALYSEDMSHPSPIGSELAARVIFEATLRAMGK